MRRREFTITRTFDAPRQLVFDAWLEPEQLAQWWGPEPLRTPLESIEVDPRPGGMFRATMVTPDGADEFPSEMRFREVVAPERLVYEWDAQRGLGAGEVTVTFTERDGRTEMTTHFVGDITDAMAKMSQEGWGTQLDKLDALLAR
jgi:uncharacterized protein YndB with AHSA1/START domain